MTDVIAVGVLREILAEIKGLREDFNKQYLVCEDPSRQDLQLADDWYMKANSLGEVL
jgi:hypothetical protein